MSVYKEAANGLENETRFPLVIEAFGSKSRFRDARDSGRYFRLGGQDVGNINRRLTEPHESGYGQGCTPPLDRTRILTSMGRAS